MKSSWKVLTVAALILVGCSKKTESTSGPGAKPGVTTQAQGEANQTYTIVIKFRPEVGKAVAVRQTEKMGGSMKMVDGGKTLVDKKGDDFHETAYVETLMEAGDKLPKKFKRKYEKAVKTEMSKTTKKSYEGKTIVFESMGDQYKASVEGGGAVSDAELQKLAGGVDENVMMEEILVPTKPVKVGETWTIDPKKLEMAFGKKDSLDLSKSRGEAKLAKVYPKDGKQFGVIEFNFTVAMTEMSKAKVDPPITVTTTGNMDAPIDGSSTAINTTLNGKMVGKGKVEAGPKKLDLDMNMEMSGRREQSIELRGQ